MLRFFFLIEFMGCFCIISDYTFLITVIQVGSGSAWIQNFCLDPDPELGKFKAGSGSGINSFGSTTLVSDPDLKFWPDPDSMNRYRNCKDPKGENYPLFLLPSVPLSSPFLPHFFLLNLPPPSPNGTGVVVNSTCLADLRRWRWCRQPPLGPATGSAVSASLISPL